MLGERILRGYRSYCCEAVRKLFQAWKRRRGRLGKDTFEDSGRVCEVLNCRFDRGSGNVDGLWSLKQLRDGDLRLFGRSEDFTEQCGLV